MTGESARRPPPRELAGAESTTELAGGVNGQLMPARYGVPEAEVIAQFRRDIDLVDRDPVVDGGRSGAYMYAPGTYELRPEGHPVAIGGRCRHSYCVSRGHDR